MSMTMAPIHWDNLRDFMIALCIVLAFTSLWVFF
jgi:hypothetical protein